MAGFFLASAGIVVLGLIDDRLTIRGRHKLIGQICIALLLCWFGYDIQSIKAFGLQLDLGLLAVPVTVGWLVLATNSLNLIDGVDGLASTVGVILSLTMACLALLNGHPGEAVLLSALAGGTLGFYDTTFHQPKCFWAMPAACSSACRWGRFRFPARSRGLRWPAWWRAGDLDGAAVRYICSDCAQLTGSSLYMTDRSHLHHCLFHLAGSARRTLYLVVLACVATCVGESRRQLKSDIFGDSRQSLSSVC